MLSEFPRNEKACPSLSFYGRIFLKAGKSPLSKKPGFPLQVLGSANALPVGFPLQSLARAATPLGVVSRLRRPKRKAPALRLVANLQA
jgi:hypothetical protein